MKIALLVIAAVQVICFLVHAAAAIRGDEYPRTVSHTRGEDILVAALSAGLAALIAGIALLAPEAA